MNLNKDVSSWAVVKPEAVMTMSPAAVRNVLTMALEDIARLGREMDGMQKRLDRWEPKMTVTSALAGQQFTDRT